MFGQLYIQGNLLLFHAIICHFSVNDNGDGGLEKTLKKCNIDGDL